MLGCVFCVIGFVNTRTLRLIVSPGTRKYWPSFHWGRALDTEPPEQRLARCRSVSQTLSLSCSMQRTLRASSPVESVPLKCTLLLLPLLLLCIFPTFWLPYSAFHICMIGIHAYCLTPWILLLTVHIWVHTFSPLIFFARTAWPRNSSHTVWFIHQCFSVKSQKCTCVQCSLEAVLEP